MKSTIYPFINRRRFNLLLKVFRSVLSDYRCNMPIIVDLELSNRCNLHCDMCWFHGRNGIGDLYTEKELETYEVYKIIDQLSPYNPHIYIGGTEPFIREDFLHILKYIKNHNMSVSFTTNGTLLNRKLTEELFGIGVDCINFSLDGNEILHDKIRGIGVYNEVTKRIKDLSDWKKENNITRPMININITVTHLLEGKVLEALKAIKESVGDGVDSYRIHHLWFITKNEFLKHQSRVQEKLGCMAPGAASHFISNSNIPNRNAIAEELMDVRSFPKIDMFPMLNYSEIVDYYSENIKSKIRCLAPFLGAVIKPNGDVKFCPDEWIDDYFLGNLRKDSFHDIWNNKKSRKFRKILFREKNFTGCKRCSWMYSFGEV